jgi:cathepsin L
VVNPIKNQGNCGGCWAFSVIQAQETQWALVKGTLYTLSEQNLVDCVTTSFGCTGGYQAETVEWVIANQSGLFNLEVDYPFMGRDGGTCKYDPSKALAPVARYFRPTTTLNETETAAALVQYGAQSIAIDAGMFSFRQYKGGIFSSTECGTTSTDHAISIVGYGTEPNGTYNSIDFWIVRNSYGPNWGEKGYVRMKRGINQCALATDVFTPQV